MTTANEYRRYAKLCEDLADTAEDKFERTTLSKPNIGVA
jgi:hypothetical protein